MILSMISTVFVSQFCEQSANSFFSRFRLILLLHRGIIEGNTLEAVEVEYEDNL